MRGLDIINEEVKSAFTKRELQLSDVEVAVSADLDPFGRLVETWVLVTKSHIYALTLEPGVDDGIDYRSYELSAVEQCRIESMTGCGMFVLTVAGEDIGLCRFSNGLSYKFGKLCKLVDKLRGGNELEDADFEDERSEAVCPTCGRPFPEPNRRICPKCLDRRSLFLRLLSFAPRYKWQITAILTCMFASSGLGLLGPYIGGRVLIDEVLREGGRYHGRILEMVLVTVATQLLSIGISIIYGRINAGMTAEVIYDLKTDLFAAMQRLSMRFFNSKQTGNLMTRVNGDALHIQGFFHDGMPYFIVNTIMIIGMVSIMAAMNWKLTILVLLPVPFIIWFMKTMFPKLWVMFSRRYRRSSALNSLVNDALTGFRVVKAFGKEHAEVARFYRRNSDLFDISVDVGNFSTTMYPIIGFLMTLGNLVIWSVGGNDVLHGEITPGILMTFIGYIGMLYGPLEGMTHTVDWWTNCMNSAQRIFEVLDTVPEIADSPNAQRLPRIKGDVELKGVTFGYEPNKPVLHSVDMKVNAGEMIGLVGHSGAGKSTITNLISRLYDVDEGSVIIDGINVKDVTIRDMRTQIGMVLQDTHLFSGSIAENIAYANPDASPDDIIRAAKTANAHDFIVKLPDGYDTVIGRRGHNLSGGERQRVSIARAILHNPRILILDEATASVDTETERQIQQALERLVKGRTTFAIAHRLSTLRNADRLVVMEQGKVVESGTHEELVKLKGVYYNLIQKQKDALKIRGVD